MITKNYKLISSCTFLLLLTGMILNPAVTAAENPIEVCYAKINPLLFTRLFRRL